MRNRYSSTEGTIFDVYEDEAARLYLVVLCQGIAWTRIGVILTPDEVELFRVSAGSLAGLARDLCRDFASYKNREIPEAIRRQIMDLDG